MGQKNWRKKILFQKMFCILFTEHGDFFLCSCPSGSKKYFCKHNLGLAIKLKHLEIPASAKSVPLNEKRSRGRPAKNKGWWFHK